MEEEFVFDQMQPELQQYLNYWAGYNKFVAASYQKYLQAEEIWRLAGKPEDKLQDVKNIAYNRHYANLSKFKQQGEEMKRWIPNNLLETYQAAKKAWLCRDEARIGTAEIEFSPEGTYRLEISRHKTGKNTWEYSKGKVFLAETNQLLAEVNRNYCSFPFAFVEKHPNGHDYLICGEDYQGQTVIELDTQNRINYLPDAAKRGTGFCWRRIIPSPDGQSLAIEGCFWACPSELVIYDFTEPMHFPLPELERDQDNDTFGGWLNANSCEMGRRYDFCPTLNKREHDMTIEELGQIEQLAQSQDKEEDDFYQQKMESYIWQRPSEIEIVKKYINIYISHNMKHNSVADPDLKQMGMILYHRLTQPEQHQLRLEPGINKLLNWAQIN